jgi:hypothetical protein
MANGFISNVSRDVRVMTAMDDKLAAMRKVHLVVCDLFLPADFAAEVCADLRLPALEKMLARGASTGQGPSAGSGRTGGVGASLENHLCELFSVPCEADAPIAPISAAFDGLGGGCDTLQAQPADCGSSRQAALPAPEGSASPCQGGCCWLRADPVHLRLQRHQLVLLPEVEVSADEAEQLCAALNEHFAGQGMEFFAPHPQRWYVRLDRLPDIETVTLSQAAGRNVRDLLPEGAESAHWHRVFNDIQMLLFAHPVNEAREARGALPVNSLWLWGGGCGVDVPLQKAYDCVSSDEVLAEMFAAAAGIPFARWPVQWNDSLTLALMERLAIRLGCQNTAAKSLVISQRERGFPSNGRQLLVWTGLRSALRRGDLDAWRAALQDFETGYAQPLWQALRTGKISQLQMDILGGDRVRHLLLSRADAWAFWRRARPLAKYSMV